VATFFQTTLKKVKPSSRRRELFSNHLDKSEATFRAAWTVFKTFWKNAVTFGAVATFFETH